MKKITILLTTVLGLFGPVEVSARGLTFRGGVLDNLTAELLPKDKPTSEQSYFFPGVAKASPVSRNDARIIKLALANLRKMPSDISEASIHAALDVGLEHETEIHLLRRLIDKCSFEDPYRLASTEFYPIRIGISCKDRLTWLLLVKVSRSATEIKVLPASVPNLLSSGDYG